MRPQEQQPYINEDIEIFDSNLQYYKIQVTDQDTNQPIPGVMVVYDDTLESLSTSQSGITFWWSDMATCWCTLTKPGYEIIRNRKVMPVQNEYSNPREIYMKKTSAASGYNYKVIVKDRDTNQPISGALITVRNMNDVIIDQDQHMVTQSDGTCVYYSDTQSRVKFTASINGYRESDKIIANGSTDIPILTTILLSKTPSSYYYYVISVKDTTGAPVKNAGFKLYSDFGYNTPYDSTTYYTNEFGFIIKDLGFKDVIPLAVYADGVSLPAGYEWDTTTRGKVPATYSNTSVGLSITVKPYTVATIYYYNIKVTDSITGSAVKDATATFTYDGQVLAKKTTNASGIAYFSSNYSFLRLALSMPGYTTGYEAGVNLTGNSTEGSYRHIIIKPKESIQILFSDDHSPAVNVNVKIYTVDEVNNIIQLGIYRTDSNGYISTLPASDYELGLLKAVVIGYPNVFIITPERNNIFYIDRKQSAASEHDIKLEKYSRLSVNGIKSSINNDKVIYDGGNDYRIKIQDPDSVTTFDIFTSLPVMMYNSKKKSVIGSVDVGLKPDVNDLRLKVINRYSGYYNPIFKDILFYNNFWMNMKQLPYTNASFDYEYKDNQGSFGVINNMWFHKVNDNKDLNLVNTLTPYYPLTGQYALDYRDYNIFSSNWDMNYYTRQTGIDTSELCNNIASMKNGLCMFGSKYLNVPETIVINGLTLGDDKDWYGEWNDEWITNPEGCPGEMMYKEVNNNSVDFYFFLTKRIIRYMTDKLYEEFKRYVSEGNSFGKPGIEDDIEEYVRKNVLKLYKLEKVRMFVRRTKKGLHNSRIENDYTGYMEYYRDGKTGDYMPVDVSYFKKHGFVEVNTITLTKMNRDDFDRKLVYNLRNGAREEFGFCFILKKI